MSCHTYLPISEKYIDRGFTESNKTEKLKEQIWDGKIGGIKIMRIVTEGQTEGPFSSFLSLGEFKETKMDKLWVFDLKMKKVETNFLQTYFRSQWT